MSGELGQYPVSVVIPAYNSAQWIKETLASVVAQTIGPDRLEVIVVDDGSTDATADIAEGYLTSTALKWQVIRQHNHGPSHARNVGWRLGKAEWIQFLDADDLLDPEKICVQHKAITSNDTAVIHSPWCNIARREETWIQIGPTVDPTPRDDPVTDFLISHNGIATGSQLYHRRFLEKVGGWDERHRHYEDYDLLFRVVLAGGKLQRVASPRPLFMYRHHGPSLSSNLQASWEGALRLAFLMEQTLQSRNALTPVRIRRIASFYGAAVRHLAAWDWKAADKWIERLYQLYPAYEPDWSWRFRCLSKIVGYRTALRIAITYRRLLGLAASPGS